MVNGRDDTPLLLFSGMGADARVFAAQQAAISNLRVPAWIKPVAGESLASYAKRWARRIDPGRSCFVGGASFGGFVALEMVKHLDVKACFLIGSVRAPGEFPKRIQVLRKVSRATRALPYELATLLSKVALLSGGAPAATHGKELLKQLSVTDASFLRWACRAVLEWEGAGDPGAVPIYQIHGADDFVLPVANTKPDVIVAGAGHALSMSHPDAVTAFLKAKMEALLGGPGGGNHGER